ncbi:MAG: type 4a pilus biogenesis protein PilO [Microgenomates group bacterium]
MAFNWQTEFHRYSRYFVDVGRFYRQKKARVYTEIVLSILTTAFFLFFAIKPTLVTIAGLVKEIKDKRLVTQKLEEKINSLNAAQKEYFSVQGDLYLVDQALPEDSQIASFVRQLEALAFRAGVSVGAIQYSPVSLKGGSNESKPLEVDFKIVLQGNYQNLKNFLLSLNNFRRVIHLDGFGFRTGKEEGLNLSVSGKAFFLKGEK